MAVQSGHKDVYWFRHERPYVQWVSLRFMLPCTEVLVVGLISFRERVDPKSLEWWWWRFRSVRFRLLFDYPRHGPCLPFMASKRRARFTFVVKW
jgi:hypothetical protein